MSLQKKEVKFNWSYKCENNLQLLKKLLTYAPIIRIVDQDKEYVVATDVSLEGLGGVLMQEGNVILYESRNLKVHERNDSMHDIDLSSIVHALKM